MNWQGGDIHTVSLLLYSLKVRSPLVYRSNTYNLKKYLGSKDTIFDYLSIQKLKMIKKSQVLICREGFPVK